MIVDIPYLESFKTRPEIFYGSIRLCTSLLDHPVIVKLEQLPEVLAEIYPIKSLSHIFNWITFFKSLDVEIDSVLLAKAYGFYWDADTEKVFRAYQSAPQPFKNWAVQKKAHVNDLRALTLIRKLTASSQDLIFNFLSLFEILNPSLSDGKKIIELLVDSAATSECEVDELLVELKSKTVKVDRLLKKLIKIRYPVVTSSDDKMKNFILKSTWASSIKVKFQRQGDKAGFEVSANVYNSDQALKAKDKLDQTLSMLITYFENRGIGKL